MPIEKISLDAIRGALSAVGDPWEAGVTSLSSLSSEEQRAYLGVNPPPGELSIAEVAQRALQNQAAMKATAIGAVSAPAAYDLRNVGGRNYVTPIKNQGGCGSCVAFGAAATVESTLRVQRGDATLAVDLSEAHCSSVTRAPGDAIVRRVGGRRRPWRTAKTRASWTRRAIRTICQTPIAADCAQTQPIVF
jgi:Cysteine protease